MTWQIHTGDCRDVLQALPERSVQTVVTSPPYFGLRDYGHGDQIGLEPTPEEFVEAMVQVFRAVRRVLRDDGTVWLNLGDTYASTSKGSGGTGASGLMKDGRAETGRASADTANGRATFAVRRFELGDGLKTKDMIGIPWMVAFALRADGWYLRSEVIWHKPSPMPERVSDRPTRAHEHLFLLSKQARYYYDADAIRTPLAEGSAERIEAGFRDRYADGAVDGKGYRGPTGGKNGMAVPAVGANRRTVWTVPPSPFGGAHFATFPYKLVEPCILAGAPEKACAECGSPWVADDGPRALDESRPQARRAIALADEHGLTDAHLDAIRSCGTGDTGRAKATQTGTGRNEPAVQALADEAKAALGGYYREFLLARPTRGVDAPTCSCDAGTQPGVVLDPFAGAGTTGVVALRQGRSFVGVELNPEYVAIARERIVGDAPLFNTGTEIAA